MEVGNNLLSPTAFLPLIGILIAWASQIYQAKDSPAFKTGNTINIVLSGASVIGWLVLKSYYKSKNASNARKLSNMSEAERKQQELRDLDAGNKALTFVFTN